MPSKKNDTRYFIYSANQMEFQKKMANKRGKNYHVGTVIANGKRLPYTELSRTGQSTYSDARIVASGDINTFKYTEPGSE